MRRARRLQRQPLPAALSAARSAFVRLAVRQRHQTPPTLQQRAQPPYWQPGPPAALSAARSAFVPRQRHQRVPTLQQRARRPYWQPRCPAVSSLTSESLALSAVRASRLAAELSMRCTIGTASKRTCVSTRSCESSTRACIPRLLAAAAAAAVGPVMLQAAAVSLPGVAHALAAAPQVLHRPQGLAP